MTESTVAHNTVCTPGSIKVTRFAPTENHPYPTGEESPACVISIDREVLLRTSTDNGVGIQHLFTTDQTPKQRKRFNRTKREPKKRLLDSVAILKTAVVAYHLPIRLIGLLAILLAIANLAECSASGRS
jgi:hypothetical protein